MPQNANFAFFFNIVQKGGGQRVVEQCSKTSQLVFWGIPSFVRGKGKAMIKSEL